MSDLDRLKGVRVGAVIAAAENDEGSGMRLAVLSAKVQLYEWLHKLTGSRRLAFRMGMAQGRLAYVLGRAAGKLGVDPIDD